MPNTTYEGVRILLEADEKYIQLDDLDDTAIRRLWPRIVADFPGFTVDLCYHNNIPPAAFLEEINAVMEDDCIALHLNRDNLKDLPIGDVTVVTEANFDIFAALHDEKNPDMYWTGTMLRKNLSNWDILALMDDGVMTGYVFIRSGWEVYALYADSTENMITLLNAAVRRGFAALAQANPDNIREILFNVDKNEPMQQDAALQVGFRPTGYYVGYTTKATG